MNDVLQEAARVGIETEYRDGLGQLHKVEPEVLSRLVRASSSDNAHRVLPRWAIARGNAHTEIRLNAPEGLPYHWEVVANERVVGGEGTSPFLTLPSGLLRGIHRLRVRMGEDQAWEEAALIVSPQQAYQGEPGGPRRVWAVAVQLYAVRSPRNWGHGDFSDLMTLIDIVADAGGSAVGLNPLHAGFDDRAQDPSPYYPSSRLFLNSLYIDVEAIPEFPGIKAAGLEQRLTELRSKAAIDYAGVAEAKLSALRLAHEHFQRGASPERRETFQRFIANHPLPIARFACFEVLRRKFVGPWWDWPDHWRCPTEEALDLLGREDNDIGVFEFIQWVAHEQLERCRRRACERGMPIGLYLDIAVGTRSDGFDAWSDQHAVLADVAVGAPPDSLNTQGQNWGLTGFNPLGLEQQRFEPFYRLLQASMRYAGAVRLDHVLGLQRLYLIPHGLGASKGTYIRLPFHALLATAALASAENACLIIGEDLGTVPENFRETLADWGIWSYQVMLFERTGDGAFAAPQRYRENALVSFATHDLPTFAGWQASHDLAVKRALHMDPGESDTERTRALNLLHEALRREGIEAAGFAGVASYLAQAPSRLLVVSMEDLLGVRDQVNLPGTTDQHPNWRQALPITLEELRKHEALSAIADIMRCSGRSLPLSAR
jgi:4-alpha-glucanotransferase